MSCETSLSPFCTPGQFVFLVVLATSTLTIAILGNRLRDILFKIKCRHHPDHLGIPISETKKRNAQFLIYESKCKNTKDELGKINCLILFQVSLIILALIRIVWSAHSEVPLLYDQFLVWLALTALGVFWFAYFIWVTYAKRNTERG